MINELIQITAAFAVSLVLFIVVDLIFSLPKEPGVSGSGAVSDSVVNAGGDRSGGNMIGNIVTSPDASAGTLLAACGVCVFGIYGGIAAAVMVYIGNRICCDKGYAGTIGALAATGVIYGFTTIGFNPESFIAGMVLAVLVVMGISHKYSSKILGRLWRFKA